MGQNFNDHFQLSNMMIQINRKNVTLKMPHISKTKFLNFVLLLNLLLLLAIFCTPGSPGNAVLLYANTEVLDNVYASVIFLFLFLLLLVLLLLLLLLLLFQLPHLLLLRMRLQSLLSSCSTGHQ